MANNTEVSNKQKLKPEDPEYDAWFRQQVEDGLREADDPNTVWVSNEEVFLRTSPFIALGKSS